MPVQHRPRRPLIAPSWQPVALVAVGLGFIGLVVLGIALHDTSDPTAFDNAVIKWLLAHTGAGAKQTLIGLSDSVLVIVLLAAIAVGGAVTHRWDLVVVTVAGPVLALLLTEVVLKPMVNRSFGVIVELTHGAVPAGSAFPSGHETGLASLTTVLLLVLGRARVGRRVRLTGVAVLTLWTIAGALGLVRSHYHYATDTVGAICVSVMCVLGIAVLVDMLTPRIQDRGRQLT